MKTVKEIVEYMDAFYGVEGIYPIGFTKEQIAKYAAEYLGANIDAQTFGFDSVDRENLRDVMVEELGMEKECDLAYGGRNWPVQTEGAPA